MIGIQYIIIFILFLILINTVVPFRITTMMGIMLAIVSSIDEIFNLVLHAIFG